MPDEQITNTLIPAHLAFFYFVLFKASAFCGSVNCLICTDICGSIRCACVCSYCTYIITGYICGLSLIGNLNPSIVAHTCASKLCAVCHAGNQSCICACICTKVYICIGNVSTILFGYVHAACSLYDYNLRCRCCLWSRCCLRGRGWNRSRGSLYNSNGCSCAFLKSASRDAKCCAKKQSSQTCFSHSISVLRGRILYGD